MESSVLHSLQHILNLILLVLSTYLIYSTAMALKGFRNLPRSNNKCHERVSVIIPARNEQSNIGECLRAILDQLKEEDEVIVVDDSSEDSTFEVALRSCDCRCKLVKLLCKPPDWTGKSWACYLGYLHSTGDVLIFIDADTIVRYGGINAICSLLERFDAVSQVPWIKCETLSCGAVEVAFTSLLRLTYPYWINKPSKSWLAGAFMAWRRNSYEEIGTHWIVRNSLVEDADLGKIASESGLSVSFFYAKYAQSTWVSSWRESLITLQRILSVRAPSKATALLLLMLFSAVSLFTYLMPLLVTYGLVNPTIGVVYVISTFGYASLSLHEIDMNPLSLFLAPIGLIIVGFSLFMARHGKIIWKGRELCTN